VPSPWLDNGTREIPESAHWWFPKVIRTARRAADLAIADCDSFIARISQELH
jgi:hypothetical protein